MKERWPEWTRRWKGALEKYKYALLVIALGAVLMLLPSGEGGTDRTAGETEVQTDCFDLEAFEEKLADTLAQIAGAGEVRVTLTVDSGSRRVLAQDQKWDGDGGESVSTVTVGRGSGSQEVVPLQTLAPEFRGALVVCPGGGDPRVRLTLTQAVSALTGLGTDRISVCEGNP